MNVLKSRNYQVGNDLTVKQMIIEHPEHGRILISQGTTGASKIGFWAGWEYGFAVKISENDDFGKPEIDALTVLPDDNCPSLGWSREELVAFAKSVEK